MIIRYNGITAEIPDALTVSITRYIAENETVMFGSALPFLRDEAYAYSEEVPEDLVEIIRKIPETFQELLLKLIDKKNMTDSEVYKRADIDRRLFSKIRSNPGYRPKKQTVLALALAMRLNADEAADLLGRAGYAISKSSRADLIVGYCIEHGIYDLIDVNALLYYFDQPLLGGRSN